MAGQIEKTRAAIVGRFVDMWPTAANRPTTLPLDRVELPNKKKSRGESKPHARISIGWTGRVNAAIGGAKIRVSGLLYLQVFVPEGAGTKDLTDAGDALAAIFDNQTFPHLSGDGNVVCSAVVPHETGARDGYEQQTYSVPFYSDENR
jgi:hypothetical protein